MSLQIQKATLTEVEALLEIFTQANQYKIARHDRAWAPGFSEKGVTWMIGLGTTYAAYLGDKIVGTVALEWEDTEGWGERENSNAGYIKRLAIHGDYHGQHIGEQIIDWAADQVQQKGRTYLRLDCTASNKKLCAYYENQGFRQVEIKHFPDWNSTSALYERSLQNSVHFKKERLSQGRPFS